MQGVCTAIELASRGVKVEIIDRGADLMTGSATANEGKIHLGYVYAGDRSLATARRMIEGATVFAAYVRRWVGSAFDNVARSDGFVFAVHRDSQLRSEQIHQHLCRCTEMLTDARALPHADYLGVKRLAPPELITGLELSNLYDPSLVLAAYRTVEQAIDPIGLSRLLKQRIRAEPSIQVKLNRNVVRLENGRNGPAVTTDGPEGLETVRYHHIVNALWDGRLAADATRGVTPGRSWMHRFKYGIRSRCPDAVADLPTTVVVHGPFGDVVRYTDGSWYLSWYPTCMTHISTELAPTNWNSPPDAALSKSILEGTLSGFAELMPPLRNLTSEQLNQPTLKGGAITAWGKTDIDDPARELHSRYDIGVHSEGGHHSIDTGKFTMAPLFARVCADRILSC